MAEGLFIIIVLINIAQAFPFPVAIMMMMMIVMMTIIVAVPVASSCSGFIGVSAREDRTCRQRGDSRALRRRQHVALGTLSCRMATVMMRRATGIVFIIELVVIMMLKSRARRSRP